MEHKKTKYHRLQVKNIWARTFFELAAIIAAIIICCTLIISGYEKSYAQATRRSTADNSAQLVRSISSIADPKLIGETDETRREYVVKRYREMLNSCFISEDMLYSGAIYTVSGSDCSLFAASDGYYDTVQRNHLSIDSKYSPIGELKDEFASAASGANVDTAAEDVYLSIRPVYAPGSSEPYALAVSSVEYRTSLEYPSLVKRRLTLISIISGILILAYYLISAAISDKKKRNGEVVITR